MGKFDQNSRFISERASDQFGALKKLPPVAFRGIDCSLLAEQYRKVRALESIEPELPGLLKEGAGAVPWADWSGKSPGSTLAPRLRRGR